MDDHEQRDPKVRHSVAELIRYLRAHPPPDGVPRIGRDFFGGPAETFPPPVGFCECGCGNPAEPPHRGLKRNPL
jgi:hypothetical protein